MLALPALSPDVIEAARSDAEALRILPEANAGTPPDSSDPPEAPSEQLVQADSQDAAETPATGPEVASFDLPPVIDPPGGGGHAVHATRRRRRAGHATRRRRPAIHAARRRWPAIHAARRRRPAIHAARRRGPAIHAARRRRRAIHATRRRRRAGHATRRRRRAGDTTRRRRRAGHTTRRRPRAGDTTRRRRRAGDTTRRRRRAGDTTRRRRRAGHATRRRRRAGWSSVGESRLALARASRVATSGHGGPRPRVSQGRADGNAGQSDDYPASSRRLRPDCARAHGADPSRRCPVQALDCSQRFRGDRPCSRHSAGGRHPRRAAERRDGL